MFGVSHLLTDPECPVCAQRFWKPLAERIYRLAERSDRTPYLQKRYRVLFEVWFPGKQEIRITSQLCTGCGFVLYTPRPEAVDLEAKYRFLGGLEKDARPPADAPVEIARSRQLYRAVARLARRRPQRARVLDFGGGDGRLMRHFLAASCECDVVDYSATCIPGVRKRGDTLADLPAAEHYDWIVCSHVIEHVADPLEIIETLSSHLDENGILYVEVPMEIWGGAPLQEEPVTHVNFFTPASLRHLLLRAGLHVPRVRLGAYLHPSGRQLLAVRAVALRVRRPVVFSPPGDSETLRFLNPGLRERLWRYALTPENILGAVRCKVKQLLRNR